MRYNLTLPDNMLRFYRILVGPSVFEVFCVDSISGVSVNVGVQVELYGVGDEKGFVLDVEVPITVKVCSRPCVTLNVWIFGAHAIKPKEIRRQTTILTDFFFMSLLVIE